MSDEDTLSLSAQQRIHEPCEAFIAAWKKHLASDGVGSQPPDLRAALGEAAGAEGRALFRELLDADVHYRRQLGHDQRRSADDYVAQFPEYEDIIRAVLSQADESVDASLGSTAAPQQRAAVVNNADAEPRPSEIGRYQVRQRVDAGAFGTVYRAFDPQLEREVAIKIPHGHRISSAEDVQAYLREARIVARLEHPHIVPVYDAGLLDDGRCYVVSKWIEGGNLAALIKERRPSFADSARLVAKVATALQVAERQKITHRDIKPANILIDTAGEPFVADFGLALRDQELGKELYQGMTPAYASPEQASGESHRVDGRSDIFSLGIVFYELLTGQRPFTGSRAAEVLDRIRTVPARPPRQLDPSIPPELQRICLKALEKRASDRYSTAFDLAQELNLFLQEPSAVNRAARPLRVFVSYRREDTQAFVGRLHDRLVARYGNDRIFLDVVSLRHGVDFRRQIDQALDRCDVLLAVIGPDWAGLKADGSRRLDDEQDYVRIEVESALGRGLPVIPVLVGTIEMPEADGLPESLRQVAYLPACSIDPGRGFDHDVGRLFASFHRGSPNGDGHARLPPRSRQAPPPPGRARRRRWRAQARLR